MKFQANPQQKIHHGRFQERQRALRARWPCGGALRAAGGGLLRAAARPAENAWENGDVAIFMVILYGDLTDFGHFLGKGLKTLVF